MIFRRTTGTLFSFGPADIDGNLFFWIKAGKVKRVAARRNHLVDRAAICPSLSHRKKFCVNLIKIYERK